MRAGFAAAALAAALALAGCDEVRDATDQAGRDAARAVVAEVIALRRPEVSKEQLPAYIDCTVARAQAAEVRLLAKAAVTGPGEAEAAAVSDILQRPDTAECIRLAAPPGRPIN